MNPVHLLPVVPQIENYGCAMPLPLLLPSLGPLSKACLQKKNDSSEESVGEFRLGQFAK